MKKSVLVLLPALMLSACAVSNNQLAIAKNIKTGDEVNANFIEFFSGAYGINSTVTNRYNGYTYSVSDIVSSDAKLTYVFDGTGAAVSITEIVSENGYAVEQYLALDNTVKTRSLSSKVSFKDNYGSPLAKLMADAATIKSYFTIGTDAQTGLIYSYTANASGLAKCSAIFDTFFQLYDDVYTWDSKSVKTTVENLVITSDKDGEPNKMTFTKVKKDRYGGFKEDFECTFYAMADVPSIPTYTNGSSAESQAALKASFDLLADKISGANFTQSVSHPYFESVGLVPYHNYYSYDEDGNGGMLSDIPWYTSDYGMTYLGIGYSSYYGYYMEGVSPESDYTGAASNDYHDTLAECLPQIATMSPQFFEYDEETSAYVFDMDYFYYDDYYFDFDILDALFGVFDACADKMGYYLSDTSSYAMDFHKLSVTIDSETGLPEFSLVYTDSYGQDLTVTTSFSDFGTTDLTKNATLKDAYALLTSEAY